MRYLIIPSVVVCLSFTLLPACTQAPKGEPEAVAGPKVDLQAEEAAIRELIKEEEELENKQDFDTVLGFFSTDVVIHIPGTPPLQGREAMRGFYEEYVKAGFVSVSYGQTKIEISSSGDMAYLTGSYHVVMESAAGQVDEEGKYVNVLRKIDGDWRYVFAAMSSNKPTS